jgi:hypothetical protein
MAPDPARPTHRKGIWKYEWRAEVEIMRIRPKVSAAFTRLERQPARRSVGTGTVKRIRGKSGQLFNWLGAGEESQASIGVYLRVPESRLPFAGRGGERHVP